MISHLRVGDALRWLVAGTPNTANLAAPTKSIVRYRPERYSTLWTQSLGRNPNRVTVGDWNGTKLISMVSARVRSGLRSWEIDRLHLDEVNQAFELLEQVVYSVGSKGAERVFLRVSSGSELVDTARKIGFFPYFNEVHLAGQPPHLKTGFDGFSKEDRTPVDVFSLFQLYCAATPHEIRQGIGMTIDQWKDSQEPAQARRNQFILESDGELIGWRSCDAFGKTTAGQTLSHPEYPNSTKYLIDISSRVENWVVPNYQQHVSELLKQKGLQEFGRYTMLVKQVTVPIRSREFSYVEA